MLTGDAGTGKTRLAEELVTLARCERQALVMEGRCVPYGEANVWWPLAEALRRSSGITAADDHALAMAKGRAAVAGLLGGEDEHELDRVVQGLVYLMDQGSLADLEPARAREEAVRSMHICLKRMTVDRPLVFVVSELHWADDLLLEFIDRLLDRVQHLPILLLATARPELAERWSPPPGRHNQILLHVDPLDPSATADLLGQLLVDLPPPEVVDALVERSGGNPLYLEELVALLARDQPFDDLPVTLRGLVAARLDGMGPEERATLENAAVIGRNGSMEALVSMAPGGSAVVVGAIGGLVAADLLRVTQGGEGWEFRSELVREVAYAILTKAERARRHAALGEWVAASMGDRPGSAELDQLAHHYGTAAELVVELDGVAGVPVDLGPRPWTGWSGPPPGPR